jgi:hypothetical protein
MLFTLGSVGILGLALLLFTTTSSRFVARNFATNHSHEATRLSSQHLLTELHDSASSFRLFTAAGSTYTDEALTGGTEVDALTGMYIGPRANGVRFRRLVGGPVPLSSGTIPTHNELSFDFTDITFRPKPGDKLVLPLISREYDITAVSGTFSPTGRVTITPAVGFSLNATAPNIVTGYFYRKVAFTVADQELRFHEDFHGIERSNYRVVRTGVTSPRPFSLLFPAPNSLSTDGLNLRVSMELTDLGYSGRRFGNGTTTLYSIYPPRNQPTPITSTN